MRDRLLGRSLCCASISATVFFEKALDFLLVGLMINVTGCHPLTEPNIAPFAKYFWRNG